MCSGKGRHGITRAGFPHSEIPGSKPACGYPRLIAAGHVLHRLLVPRHPPHALTSLAIKFAPDRLLRCMTKPDLAIKRALSSLSHQDWTIRLSKSRLATLKLFARIHQQLLASAERPGRQFLTDRYGGEYRARTGDLRLAKPALSQLS